MPEDQIAIVTEHANTVDFLYKDLKNLFSDHLKVNGYCFERNNVPSLIKARLVLIADTSSFERVNNCVEDGTEIIVINRTLTKKGLDKLLELEDGTRAMLVNPSINTAVNTVSTIYKLGVRHINLTPVYPEMEEKPELDIAITPGESALVPDYVEKIIDIGDRVLDISTIMDIIIRFDLNHILDTPDFRKYMDKIVPSSFGLEKLMGKTDRLESQLEIVLNLLDVGLISTNSAGVVNAINEKAERILGFNKSEILGKKAEKYIDEIPFQETLREGKKISGEIVKINGWDVVLTMQPIKKYNTTYGTIAIVKKYINTEKNQQKLRAQLIDKGHVAEYIFADIVGDSEKIKDAKNIAKRMAKSNSTILLIGESGTGKELFAQAIHNASQRKNFQFVAVNCAALPENLLESELFGYEKGAFTGADSSKPGLFELAHNGTLFLDEISEISPKLQTRLLRVLEEREVMRVGGERVINVDVRIITASNKNLKKLVEENDFRRDLYYRLSVLPLKIPSLNERKEDIIPLIESLKNELNAQFELSKKALEVFFEHNWEGNVRELRNYIEYFSNLDKDVIKIENFPFTLTESHNFEKELLNDEKKELITEFGNEVADKFDDYIFILEELNRRFENKERAGRRSLADAAKKANVYLSEMEVRNILQKLADYDFVKIGRGRQGTKITELGKEAIRYFKNGN
ncbi:MAG: sigma-54 interaction domain-containing protein [Bacillota bacterium]